MRIGGTIPLSLPEVADATDERDNRPVGYLNRHERSLTYALGSFLDRLAEHSLAYLLRHWIKVGVYAQPLPAHLGLAEVIPEKLQDVAYVVRILLQGIDAALEGQLLFLGVVSLLGRDVTVLGHLAQYLALAGNRCIFVGA